MAFNTVLTPKTIIFVLFGTLRSDSLTAIVFTLLHIFISSNLEKPKIVPHQLSATLVTHGDYKECLENPNDQVTRANQESQPTTPLQ